MEGEAMEQITLSSSIPIIISTLVLFFLILIKRGVTKPRSQRPKPPPGPWKLPFIGSMHHLAGHPTIFHALRQLAGVHGPIMLLKIGQVDLAVASSAEAAEEILKRQDLNFASRPQIASTRLAGYGSRGIFFCHYGPYWKQLQRLCFTELLSAKRTRSFSNIRQEEILDLMRDIARTSSTETAINMGEKVTGMSNAIISRAALGKKSECPERILAIFKEALALVVGTYFADVFPSLSFLDNLTGVNSKLRRLHWQLDEILRDIVKQHELKAEMNRSGKEVEEDDFVDVLLRVKDDPQLEIPLTMVDVKAVILDIFMGGTKTSSAVIVWVMSELMRNPDAMAKAQKEVRELTLNGTTGIQESDLDKLQYMKSIIKETLRLHPPGPLLLRTCKETCVVLGHQIQAGTKVCVNAWAINRDPRYWDDDAESFKPERFEGNSSSVVVDFKGSNVWYLPFGAGRRICAGTVFAVSTVELAVAQLLMYFDWKLAGEMRPEELDMNASSGLVAERITELKLLATPRIPLPSAT